MPQKKLEDNSIQYSRIRTRIQREIKLKARSAVPANEEVINPPTSLQIWKLWINSYINRQRKTMQNTQKDSEVTRKYTSNKHQTPWSTGHSNQSPIDYPPGCTTHHNIPTTRSPKHEQDQLESVPPPNIRLHPTGNGNSATIEDN